MKHVLPHLSESQRELISRALPSSTSAPAHRRRPVPRRVQNASSSRPEQRVNDWGSLLRAAVRVPAHGRNRTPIQSIDIARLLIHDLASSVHDSRSAAAHCACARPRPHRARTGWRCARMRRAAACAPFALFCPAPRLHARAALFHRRELGDAERRLRVNSRTPSSEPQKIARRAAARRRREPHGSLRQRVVVGCSCAERRRRACCEAATDALHGEHSPR